MSKRRAAKMRREIGVLKGEKKYSRSDNKHVRAATKRANKADRKTWKVVLCDDLRESPDGYCGICAAMGGYCGMCSGAHWQ